MSDPKPLSEEELKKQKAPLVADNADGTPGEVKPLAADEEAPKSFLGQVLSVLGPDKDTALDSMDKIAKSQENPASGTAPKTWEQTGDITKNVHIDGEKSGIVNEVEAAIGSGQATRAINAPIGVAPAAQSPRSEMLASRHNMFAAGGIEPALGKMAMANNMADIQQLAGETEANHRLQQAGILNETQAILAAKQQEAAQRHAKELSEAQRRESELKSYADAELGKKLDEGRFWSNPMHMFGAILSVVATPFGSKGGDGGDAVIEAINRDLANQKENMARARTLYDAKKNSLSTFRDLAGDANLADAMFVAKAKEMAALKMDEVSSKMQSDDARTRGKMMANQLRSEALTDWQNIQLKTYKDPQAIPRGMSALYDTSDTILGRRGIKGSSMVTGGQPGAGASVSGVSGMSAPGAGGSSGSGSSGSGSTQPASTSYNAIGIAGPGDGVLSKTQSAASKALSLINPSKYGKVGLSKDGQTAMSLPSGGDRPGPREEYLEFAGKDDPVSSMMKEAIVDRARQNLRGIPVQKLKDGRIVAKNAAAQTEYEKRMDVNEAADRAAAKDLASTMKATTGYGPGDAQEIANLQYRLEILEKTRGKLTQEKWQSLMEKNEPWGAVSETLGGELRKHYMGMQKTGASQDLEDFLMSYRLMANEYLKDHAGTAVSATDEVRNNKVLAFNPKNIMTLKAGLNAMSARIGNATSAVYAGAPITVRAEFMKQNPAYRRYFNSKVSYRPSEE